MKEKILKVFIIVALIFVMCLIFISCRNELPEGAAVIGTWEGVDEESGKKITLSFGCDGSLFVKRFGQKRELINYSSDKKYIYILDEDRDGEYEYKVKDDKLYIKSNSGDEFVEFIKI